jgi:hypothetical protein
LQNECRDAAQDWCWEKEQEKLKPMYAIWGKFILLKKMI